MPRQLQKSFVWEAFTKIDQKNVKCNSCSTVYKLFGTTNLISHLKRRHPVLYLELSGEQSMQQSAPTNSAPGPSRLTTNTKLNNKRLNDNDGGSEYVNTSSHEAGPPATSNTSHEVEPPAAKRPRQLRIVPPTRVNQKAVDDALVEMVALDYQPLQIVENSGFKNFANKLNPDYSLPSRKTLTNKLVHEKYQVCNEALKDMLVQVDHVSLSTDMWTSDSNKACITVTAHFVHEAKLKSYILSTEEVVSEHNAENISEALKKVATQYKIFDKVVAFVTDNASNVKKAINDLKKRNVYCVAHTLNLAVKDCTQQKEINDLLSKCRSLVGHFKHSSKSLYKLKETQKLMNLPELTLKQDVVTRWNATLTMIDRLIKLKIPLSATLPQIQTNIPNLTTPEWDILEDFAVLLGPFEKMTVALSGELYPTLSSVIPLVRGLQNVIMKKTPKSEIGLFLKESLISVVSKRLGVFETNRTASKATFLDPRLKKKGFGLEANAENAQKWVIEELTALMRQEQAKGIGSTTIIAPQTNAAENEDDDDDLWESLDKKVAEVINRQTPSSSAMVAVDQYLDMPYLARNEDPLKFWDSRKHMLPGLAKMALKYLSIPATSVPSERVFSKAGLMTNDRRNRLKPKKLNEIMFLNGWFTAQRKQ